MRVFRVLDVETTGVKTDEHPAQIVEYGFQDVELHDDGTVLGGVSETSFVRSSLDCDVEARAVHHITDAEIASGVAVEKAFLALMAGQPDFFVVHNAAFEKEFFTGGAVPWICTYKCALRLWPDAPAHSNQVLRYWLGLPVDPQRAFPPHRALPDAYTTAHILREMLRIKTPIGDLVAWSKEPPMPKYIGFGKYRNQEWAGLPFDYLQWIATKSDLDKDTKWLAKYHMKVAQ